MSKLTGNNILFLCSITLVLISQCSCQIHRAKPLKTNSTRPLHRFPPAAFSDFDNEATVLRATHADEGSDENFLIGHSKETWMYAIASAMLVGLSGIFPLLVIPLEAGKALKSGAPAARLKLLLSFAVGGLLGDVFLHLLPEAWAHLDQDGHDHDGHFCIGLWIIAGIFCFLIVEKIFPEPEEEEEEVCEHRPEETETRVVQTRGQTPDTAPDTYPRTRSRARGREHSNGTSSHANGHATAKGRTDSHQSAPTPGHNAPTHIKTSGWLNLLANMIDNFTHGLAVAGSYCISTKTGLITTAAVLLHEVPHEVGDFAILLRSGFDRWKAAKAQLLTASGGIIGAVVALTAESAQVAGDRTAWVLPFTSGGFIYIALVTVVPDLLKEESLRHSMLQVLFILVGIAMVSGVTMLCE